jgi:hypothetical protein
MKFDFIVKNKTVPGACIIGGIALIAVPALTGLGSPLIGLGVFLLIVGIGLQVLYLYLRYRR